MLASARGFRQRFGDPGAVELIDQCGGFGRVHHHAGDDAGPADKHHVDVGFGHRQLGAELGDKFADGIEIDGFAIDETLDEFFVGHIDRFLFDLTVHQLRYVISPEKLRHELALVFDFPPK